MMWPTDPVTQAPLDLNDRLVAGSRRAIGLQRGRLQPLSAWPVAGRADLILVKPQGPAPGPRSRRRSV
jgi:hypothetical protein